MYRSVVLFVALRYMFRKSINPFNQCIYWVSSIAVMLGVMAMIIVLSVMNGFERKIKQNLLYFTPHALLTTKRGYVQVDEQIPDVVLNKLHNIIIHMERLVLSNSIILQSAKKMEIGVMLGINSDRFEPLSRYLFDNRINQLISGKYYIIIGSALAKKLEVCVNDQIRLIIPSISQCTPIGYIPSQRLFTILDIYMTNSEIDEYQVLVDQKDGAKLMRYPLQCMTGWRLWLSEPFQIGILDQLKLSNDWIIKDWRKYKGSLFQAIAMEKNVMSLLLSLIIIAAGFNIVSFLILLIIEKNIDIAILRTFGLTRFQVMSLFVIQGFSCGLFGVVFGSVLGVFLSHHLNQVLSFLVFFVDIPLFPVDVRYSQVFTIIFMTFMLILLVMLYPVWRATYLYPIRTLRRG